MERGKEGEGEIRRSGTRRGGVKYDEKIGEVWGSETSWDEVS